MQIFIKTTSAEATLRRLRIALSAPQLATATSRAINKTLQKTRTRARTEIKKVYNISQKNLGGVDIQRANPSTLTGRLVASRKPIPLDAFAPRQETGSSTRRITRRGALKVTARTRAPQTSGITIEIYKGKRELIPYAFLLPGGAIRVFARGQYRTGTSYGFIQRHTRVAPGSDLPIKPLITVSDFGAILNTAVLTPIAAATRTDYPTQLENQITFILNTF